MKTILSILLIVNFNLHLFSKTENNITIIFNDSKITSLEIKQFADDIMAKTGKNLTSLKIIHYSQKDLEPALWNYKKKVVEYRTTKIQCSFNFCENMESTISNSRSFEKNKLFFCESRPICSNKDLNIEMIDLPSKNSIIDKIEEEIFLNNTLKKAQTLFFIIDHNNILTPQISFENKSITINKGEKIQLKPLVKGSFVKIEWQPELNLSCKDCLEPFVSPESEANYSVKVTDENGCPSNTENINIKVNLPEEIKTHQNEVCNCTNNSKVLSDVFNKIKIKKYSWITKREQPGPEHWKISSNSAGNWEYDMLFSPNCAEFFTVELLRIGKNNKEVVWSETYTINQVNLNSGNLYLDIYKEYFSFRMDFNNISEILQKDEDDVDNTVIYKIKIKSTDKSSKNCKEYISPNLKFFPCMN